MRLQSSHFTEHLTHFEPSCILNIAVCRLLPLPALLPAAAVMLQRPCSCGDLLSAVFCQGACGDVNRNVMAAPAPWKDRADYLDAENVAEDIANLLAPQAGSYYDVWLDGEKWYSETFEVSDCAQLKISIGAPSAWAYPYTAGVQRVPTLSAKAAC